MAVSRGPHAFDVVLMDNHMRAVDGSAAAEVKRE